MNVALQDAKKKLREAVLKKRDAMPAPVRDAATRAITRRVFGLDAYRHARGVLAYMSFGAELDTQPILEALLLSGKMAVLPRVDRVSKSLKLHRIESQSDLVEGVWGIREPRADLPTVAIADIDMVLMPGVAFDRAGHRLGYGAGFYDRLLAPTTRPPLRVAATFDCQVVDAVPAGPTDQSIHFLITESGLHEITP